MTGQPPSSPLTTDQAATQQAAIWFVRMRGPDAETFRPEFDAWLSGHSLHRSAYSRIAEVFALGRVVAPADPQPARKLSALRPRTVMVALASMVAIVGAAVALHLISARSITNRAQIAIADPSGRVAPRYLGTDIGEKRTFHLADGSSVTLATDSLLVIDFDGNERLLRLERGRVRFEVAHERRPFVVSVGNGFVTARGTVFDVGISADHVVQVRLLHGSIDVDMPAPAATSGAKERRFARLVPGQMLAFVGRPLPMPSARKAMDDRHGPDALIDFDGVRLSDLVADANRSSRVPIRLADDKVGGLRVSGIFRINDPDRLASRLAFTFDLTIDRDNPDEIILRRR